MSKTQNIGDGPTTQNQNNAMSDDPRDGSRNTTHSTRGAGDPPPGDHAPDEQGPERLAELGRQSTAQNKG